MLRRARSLAVLAAALLAAAVPATADARGRHHPRTAIARAAQHCANADLAPAPGNLAAVRAAILCLHNEIRAQHGLSRLGEDGRLRRAAAGHSSDMVAAGYFAHTALSGATMVDRIQHSGYIRPRRAWLVGENLEWGTGHLSTPRGAMQAWMDSAPHRANVLRRGYRELGVGVSLGTPGHGGEPGATYTVDFGAIS